MGVSADGSYAFELHALGIHRMVQYWYQYIIIGILGISVFAALGYIVWLCYLAIRKWIEKRRISVPPADTKEFLQRLSRKTEKYLETKVVAGKPKSFGVYYGEFSNPPTREQYRVLTEWHTLILDPLQPGVIEALSTLSEPPTYVVGRIDIGALANGIPDDDRVGKVRTVTDTIAQYMGPSADGTPSPFNGVMIANWDSTISPGICNELLQYIVGLNLNVYNEITAPRFFDKVNSTIKVELLSGVVFINGSILPNGERRDFFNLMSMQRALEIVFAQSCLREFAVLMCEIIDDECTATNAVIKRSFSWTSFYTAIPWIGHRASLTDAAKHEFIQPPDGAFDFLKRADVIDIQESWRFNAKISPQPVCDVSVYNALEAIIPGITETCQLYNQAYESGMPGAKPSVHFQHFDWVSKVVFRTVDPLSTSSRGLDYSGLGCFPIGMHSSQTDFDLVIRSQTRLLKLSLLKPVPREELVVIGQKLHKLADCGVRNWPDSAYETTLIRQLADALTASADEKHVQSVEVYVGLDTAFRSLDFNSQFWGVFDGDNDLTRLFVSRNATDIAGTILHTYLSSKRCERSKCFEAEYALAEVLGEITEAKPLSGRMMQDIEMLTPMETLVFLQAIAISGSMNHLLATIKKQCEYALIDVSSSAQLKSLNTISYLRGDITVEELITTRIQWYRQNKIRQLPRVESAIELFNTVDQVVDNLLRNAIKDQAAAIVSVLDKIIQPGKIDVRADILALAIFCSFRRHAYEEVYLETTDRCPLFNDQPDQIIVFAELWGLGSHTEAYLDITPKALGKVLFDKYREYYNAHPPPIEADDSENLATAYASARTDVDREGITSLDKGFSQKIKNTTYLGVYAVPALVDILLLTTIGRGLYLSAFMTEIEQQMSTDALVIALVLCGAVSSWVGSGGSYYLYAMVYPTMNMFMLTRLIGGLVFTTIAAVFSMVAVGLIRSVYGAVIFVLYLISLSIYLFLLSVMANLQFTGSPLPSGRTAIGQSLCVLILSPIITTYVPNHDIVVYLSVIWGFVIFFVFRSRQVISQWNTWLMDVPGNSDQEVLDWYLNTHHNGDEGAFAGMTAPAAMELSRTTLFQAVIKERAKSFFARPTTDQNVLKLARSYPASVFLLNWYSHYMHAAKPLPFTSTWNLQIKVALNTLRGFDKGLRLHNGFIHWRQANSEIAHGMLYFLLALLDRWIELFCGGRLVGLAILRDDQSRIAVGLGLVYYLFGAVALDVKTHPLYEAVRHMSLERLQSAEHLNDVAKGDANNKQRLYWVTLAKFLAIHVWGLSFVTSFFWVYVEGETATLLLLAYMLAYTGLLWFQYNKVFAGPSALPPTAFAVLIGFAIGIPLRILRPTIFWNDVFALGVATWTAGILTFRTVNLSAPKFSEVDEDKRICHSQKSIGPHNDITSEKLDSLFNELESLPANERFSIKPPGTIASEVMQILTAAKHSPKALELKAAFPLSFALLDQIIISWDTGETIVEGVSSRHMIGQHHDVCAVSRKLDNKQLKIFVIVDSSPGMAGNLEVNCHAIAEAIVHETCEVGLGMSHSDAVIAELLVSSTEELALPQRMKRQLEESSSQELLQVLNRRDDELVRHLCLDTHCDRQWESLPNDVRVMFLRRVACEPFEVNDSEVEWIESNRCDQKQIHHQTYLARRDLHACVSLLIDEYAAALLRDPVQKTISVRREIINDIAAEAAREVAPLEIRSGWRILLKPFTRIRRFSSIFVKFLFLGFIAEPEYQRELVYVLRGNFFKRPITFLATALWSYARFLQNILLPFFFFYNRKNITDLERFMKKGTVTVMNNNRIVVHNLRKPTTAFLEVQPDGTAKLCQYTGEQSKQPETDATLISVSYYDSSLKITRRQEWAKGKMVNDFMYEYHHQPSRLLARNRSSSQRIPSTRICVEGKLQGEIIDYNRKGFVKSGKAFREGTPYEFAYEYRRKAKFDDELLRVKYTFNPESTNPLVAHVWWCVPPIRKVDELDRWIPFIKVTQAQFDQDVTHYETKWSYDHKCHPTMSTLVNGEEVQTPDMILHDHLQVFSKPASTSFADEDPLLPFNSTNAGFFTRLFRMHRRYIPVSTSRARTFLWKSWKDSMQLDGVTARWLDEVALRSDPILKPYWNARDAGNLRKAIKFLRANGDAIMASVDIDHDVSAWTALAFKMSDFFSLGQGGDTSINTRTANSQINDTHEQLHVLATDTGTWPTEGGGVSCCRRDMVDNLHNIKWHIVAEAANDYSVPRFQIEHNVQSLKILPLWGLDFLTPTHGIIENQLDTEMESKLIDTNDRDIVEKFFPILTLLVRGARAIQYNPSNIKEFTRMLVQLNAYFENRNWGAVWNSDLTKNRWRELWLSKSMENARPISLWFDVEKPTLGHLDEALELFSRYLFIFSIPVPEQVPTVFQATHHSIGALYGIVCKIKRGCSFQIWDHSIIWRECNTYLSAAQCGHAPFIRNSLIGLMRLAAQLNLYNADVILPCTNFFNPGWEVEIGTCEGVLEHRKRFARKIDPVINGICNMESFDPIENIKTKKPTVTMLSHVQYVKDIKNALLAADIIVNEWGFKDYRLDIYGGVDRMPPYTVECQELLASKSLRGYVTLKGYGNPKAVLEDTWVFLNSSISEGLPLAIGEAALTGAPIVCTDVGATFQVLTDPDDPKKRYGVVVAPNDPRALARGQISLLSVMDEWEQFGEDEVSPGPTPDKFTEEDAKRITQRMIDKTPQRRALGLQLRKIVQKSFSGDRYLREHEQMLWIGKHKNEARRQQIATDTNQTVIDMLDDIATGLEVQEYRPQFFRHVSGFSAFNSVLGSEARFSLPSTAPSIDERRSRKYLEPGPSAWNSRRSSWEEDSEKGDRGKLMEYISDTEGEDEKV